MQIENTQNIVPLKVYLMKSAVMYFVTFLMEYIVAYHLLPDT